MKSTTFPKSPIAWFYFSKGHRVHRNVRVGDGLRRARGASTIERDTRLILLLPQIRLLRFASRLILGESSGFSGL